MVKYKYNGNILNPKIKEIFVEGLLSEGNSVIIYIKLYSGEIKKIRRQVHYTRSTGLYIEISGYKYLEIEFDIIE